MSRLSSVVSFLGLLSLNILQTYCIPLHLPHFIQELEVAPTPSASAAPIAHDLHAAVKSGVALAVAVSTSGEIDVMLGGSTWFQSRDTRVHAGEWLSTAAGTLVLQGSPKVWQGADDIGCFNATQFTYVAVEPDQLMVTTVRDYTYGGLSFVKFEQTFPNGLEFTQTSLDLASATEQVLSSFPSFSVDTLDVKRGFFTYYNQMVGGMANGTKFGTFSRETAAELVGGSLAGPTVIFTEDTAHTAVLSAGSNFLTVNTVYNKASNTLDFGPLGAITHVPAGYSCSMVLYAGTGGIGHTVTAYGEAMRRMYAKSPVSDISLEYLGYSTDNGAYYYYNTPNNSTFESELLALHDNLTQLNVPVQYILLDSWWYYRGPSGGVMNWTARPDVFPNGLKNFHEKTGWPIQAHNRYWDAANVYARANSGSYQFIQEDVYAMPHDQALWDMLMSTGKEWGLTVYEQDWLHNEWEYMHASRQSATLSHDWLSQMNNAAVANNITIQYCMAYPRFALASLEFAAVNQIRASDDYYVDLAQKFGHPVNLYLGVSSLLTHALGLRPSKDVFLTTPTQPNNHYGNVTATNIEAHALVATYSTGPVAFGDAIGLTNVDLVMRSCSANGTLLSPSRPMVAHDAMLLTRALGVGNATGELWYASSEIQSGNTIVSWFHLLSMNQSSPLTISPASFHTPSPFTDSMLAYSFSSNKITFWQELSLSDSVTVNASKLPQFQLLHFAPIFWGANSLSGWTLLGETNKWVPTSPRRFQKILSVTESAIEILVAGQAQEQLQLAFVYLSAPGAEPTVVQGVCEMGAEWATVGAAKDSTGQFNIVC